MTHGIEFQNITKRYNADPSTPAAVNNISFFVPKGSLTTILGPSGCGKTTTLRMIAGLESANAGKILIAGQDVTHLSATERNVSLVFQSYALFPHMRVIENVAYGLVSGGMNKTDAKAKAMETLDLVGLKHLAERQPSELSGGQQQRVAVARALVIEPQVLLFDEPLSNLDARLRRSMREEIRSLQQRLNLTVAYVTHDQSEAMAVSDQIIVMNHGVIAQMGTPQDLYARPANAFVAEFMGDATLLKGEAAAGIAQFGGLRLPCDTAFSGAVSAAVRPHAWILSSTNENALQGKVLSLAYQGAYFEITIKTELGSVLMQIPSHNNTVHINDIVYICVAEEGFAVVKD